MVHLANDDVHAILQGSELLELLELLQPGGRQRDKSLQGRPSKRIEANMQAAAECSILTVSSAWLLSGQHLSVSLRPPCAFHSLSHVCRLLMDTCRRAMDTSACGRQVRADGARASREAIVGKDQMIHVLMSDPYSDVCDL